jgi:hypothetical protein
MDEQYWRNVIGEEIRQYRIDSEFLAKGISTGYLTGLLRAEIIARKDAVSWDQASETQRCLSKTHKVTSEPVQL